MSVDRYKPHVFLLPEDDANRQIAVGFHQGLDGLFQRQCQILRPACGWLKALKCVESDEFQLDRYPHRHVVIVIDFDSAPERLADARQKIRQSWSDRVFIVGAFSEPEKLRAAGLGSYEEIGLKIANDCRAGSDEIWNHDLLRHNADELTRLRGHVRPILFS